MNEVDRFRMYRFCRQVEITPAHKITPSTFTKLSHFVAYFREQAETDTDKAKVEEFSAILDRKREESLKSDVVEDISGQDPQDQGHSVSDAPKQGLMRRPTFEEQLTEYDKKYLKKLCVKSTAD